MAFLMLAKKSASLWSRSAGSLCSAIIFTMALPMITPSEASAACFACSGPETPNPTKTGNETDFFISLTLFFNQSERASLVPVVPVREI